MEASEDSDSLSSVRFAWDDFPRVWIHAEESAVRRHPLYKAAKSGDPDAAFRLVSDSVSDVILGQLRENFHYRNPILVCAHSVEGAGVNAIPAALSDVLADLLKWCADARIVQTNIVGHTGADGFSRLARQARFDGPVISGECYILVDDFVGQGGTLANLRSHVMMGWRQSCGSDRADRQILLSASCSERGNPE